MTNHRGFTSLLYMLLIFEKTEHINIHGFAKAADITESTAYKYCAGELTFPCDLVPVLYSYTKDDRVLNFFLKDTDKMLAPRPQAGQLKSLESEALEAGAAVGTLHAHIVRALQDKIISDLERKKIERILDTAQMELEEVRLKVLQQRSTQ